jgi:hypothetical protein
VLDGNEGVNADPISKFASVQPQETAAIITVFIENL